MWKDFKIKNPDNLVSYSYYAAAVQRENIGFNRPSQDVCKVCEAYEQHKEQCDTVAECEVCTVSKAHQNTAQAMRRQYQCDRDTHAQGDEGRFAVDMQKVLLLPKMRIKEHFFVSRLTLFNETFTDLSGKQDISFLWHEGITGRTAAEVASTFYKAMMHCSSYSSFVFWLDNNCSAQNKNWTLFSLFANVVNSSDDTGPETVTLKYFERGHTFMRADSVHGDIANAIKRK
jgi:hypothetical protein